MNLLGAKIDEVPDGLRSLINVGSFLKSLLDHADNNARERVNMGERPDLLEDVLKGGHIHIPKLEELVGEFAGRTTAKTMVDFMMQTHGVIGLLNTLMDNARSERSTGSGPAPHSPPQSRPPRPDFQPASAGEQHSSSPGPRPRHRPEYTTAADPAAQRAAQQGTHVVELDINVGGHGAAANTPRADTPPGKTTIGAFKMEVARHLLAFEEAVATEQAELRRRICSANGEVACLRADLRRFESELKFRASSGAPEPAAEATPPPTANSPNRDGEAVDTSTGTNTEDSSDDDALPEEQAAEIMAMIMASQKRVRESLSSDLGLVEAMAVELHDIRQQVDRLQAPS